MLSVRVQKDIGEYTEKIVGKLSARTLVCLAGGLASAVGTAAICQFALGIEVRNAALPVMCASMPFWLAGFWRPYHMKLEKFVPLWLDFQLEDQRVFYRSTPVLEGAQPAPAPGNVFHKVLFSEFTKPSFRFSRLKFFGFHEGLAAGAPLRPPSRIDLFLSRLRELGAQAGRS